MDVKDFDYELPEELIAQDPLEDRSGSRLMVLDKKTGEVEHRIFKDILEYLKQFEEINAWIANNPDGNVFAHGFVPKEEIFKETGIAFNWFNTLYQLLSSKLSDDVSLKEAKTMLFIGYFPPGTGHMLPCL